MAAPKKRFWKEVSINESPAGFAVALDGREIKTPAKSDLLLPNEELAKMVAAEWESQIDEINPDEMPATRMANSVIDKVIPNRASICDMLGAYGETDLLCYLSQGPKELVKRQRAAWQPLLDWVCEELDAEFVSTQGVMYVAQDSLAVEKLRRELDQFNDFQLAGIHDLVTISGSLILALAVATNHLNVAKAWEIAQIDEIWQEEQWGTDEEAQIATFKRQSGIYFAANFFRAAT